MDRKIMLLAASVLICTGVSAQDAGRGGTRPENPAGEHMQRMTPKDAATRRTDDMDREIGLSEKQYKKIRKIFLKEENARNSAMQAGPGGMPPGGPGEKPGGGHPSPGGFGGGMPGGFGGPGGHGGGPGMPLQDGFPAMERQIPMVGGKAIDSDEYIDAREEKFKKILTPEQYGRWRRIHPDPSGTFESERFRK